MGLRYQNIFELICKNAQDANRVELIYESHLVHHQVYVITGLQI